MPVKLSVRKWVCAKRVSVRSTPSVNRELYHKTPGLCWAFLFVEVTWRRSRTWQLAGRKRVLFLYRQANLISMCAAIPGPEDFLIWQRRPERAVAARCVVGENLYESWRRESEPASFSRWGNFGCRRGRGRRRCRAFCGLLEPQRQSEVCRCPRASQYQQA